MIIPILIKTWSDLLVIVILVVALPALAAIIGMIYYAIMEHDDTR